MLLYREVSAFKMTEIQKKESDHQVKIINLRTLMENAAKAR